MVHMLTSLGMPKPLIYTHDWISRCVGSTVLPAVGDLVNIGRYITSGSMFLTLPPFHVSIPIHNLEMIITKGVQIAGVGMGLFLALFHGSVTVYPLPGPPPTTEAFIDAISNTDVDWACVSPVVVDELGKRKDLLEIAASRLQYLSYGGGSVPKISGDAVAQKLPVWTILGSSEAGLIPLSYETNEYNNAEDWLYMRFNPALKHEMRHLHDDFYELVLVHNADTASFQPVFALFPDAKEFHTKDLFTPHPSREGLWYFHSRLDDVIVFLNGEKTNPISFEHQITAHPEVRTALVVGAQRVEASLLVEPTANVKLIDGEKTALIERIWPIVEQANKATPAHAQVAKSKIIFVDPGRPMARAGKGTVQRAATLALYATEINELYEQEEALKILGVVHPPEQNLKTLVRNAVTEMVFIDDLDFFQLGMDSLGALRLQRALKKLLPGVAISNSTVYNNPSVNALVRALAKLTSTTEMATAEPDSEKMAQAAKHVVDGVTGNDVTTKALAVSTDQLAKVLETFCREIDAISPRAGSSTPEAGIRGATVLLTGSTGAIGSYVLEAFLSRPDVAHVYCLNRTADAHDRQIKGNQDRNLGVNFPVQRVTFLYGDLTKSSFGLSHEKFAELIEEVTHVVHNAWPVNFSLPLTAFTPSITGVVSLVCFAAQSKRSSSLQFLSSIASVFNHPDKIVSETISFDLSTPSPGGYGQSKYLAERLIDHASKKLGINASVVRIGQVAGAARTANGWNRQEWLPSLVTTSAFIGVLPDMLPNGGDEVNWVPIDHLAGVLVELALAPTHVYTETFGAVVNQIVHPRPVSWNSVLPVIRKAIEESGILKQPIQTVTYGEWLLVLRAKSMEAEKDPSIDYATLVHKLPGLKLIDFYDGLQGGAAEGLNRTLSMQRTSEVSPTLAKLEPLQGRWIAGWVADWVEAAKFP